MYPWLGWFDPDNLYEIALKTFTSRVSKEDLEAKVKAKIKAYVFYDLACAIDSKEDAERDAHQVSNQIAPHYFEQYVNETNP